MGNVSSVFLLPLMGPAGAVGGGGMRFRPVHGPVYQETHTWLPHNALQLLPTLVLGFADR